MPHLKLLEGLSVTDLEQVTPAITRSWLDDGRIVVFTLSSLTREAVNAGFDAITSTMAAWDICSTYYGLYIFETAQAFLSPYFQHRARELRTTLPSVRGYTAVIAPGALGHLLKMATEHMHGTIRQMTVFPTVNQGAAWLREKMRLSAANPSATMDVSQG